MNGVSRSVSTAVVIASAPSDEVHQLDRIPFRYGHTREAGASHDRAVMLHHHGGGSSSSDVRSSSSVALAATVRGSPLIVMWMVPLMRSTPRASAALPPQDR